MRSRWTKKELRMRIYLKSGLGDDGTHRYWVHYNMHDSMSIWDRDHTIYNNGLGNAIVRYLREHHSKEPA